MDKELWYQCRRLYLERFSSLKYSINPNHVRLAEKYGYLPYMITRYEEIFNDELTRFLEGNEREIPASIRCNDLKIPCITLTEKLREKGVILSPIPWAPHGFWIHRSPINIGSTHEYLRGYYQIQRAASMLPVYILNPKESEIVLDAAAAPGVKTTQMAQLMKNRGVIIAVDISRERMKALRSNIARLGVHNVIAIRIDLRKFNTSIKFNKVLLDAPCTGEGLIPIKPGRKRSRTINDLRKLGLLQVEMLLKALDLVQEGGTIVYSTCSIAPEENELVIDTVLKIHKHASITKIQSPIGSRGLIKYFNLEFTYDLRYAIRLYPFKHGTEGFFIAKIIKERER